jgi:hypothetical protein
MSSRRTELTVAVIAVLITVTGVVIAVLAWLYPVSPPAPEPKTTEPVATETPEEPSTLPQGPGSNSPSPAPQAEDLSHVELVVERGSNGAGWDIGDQLYALNDDGRLSIGVVWTAYDRDGEARSDSECQIVVRLDGPGQSQSRRFTDCNAESQTFFDGWPEVVTAAGSWTASATDELTGLSSSVEFTVLSDRNG